MEKKYCCIMVCFSFLSIPLLSSHQSSRAISKNESYCLPIQSEAPEKLEITQAIIELHNIVHEDNEKNFRATQDEIIKEEEFFENTPEGQTDRGKHICYLLKKIHAETERSQAFFDEGEFEEARYVNERIEQDIKELESYK